MSGYLITVDNVDYIQSGNFRYNYQKCISFINNNNPTFVRNRGTHRVMSADMAFEDDEWRRCCAAGYIGYREHKQIMDTYKTENTIEMCIEEQTATIDKPANSLIPKENINICFVGGVSTGKSTILNAIFCEQLTQCKIKRTTMVPTVYIENRNSSNPFENEEVAEQVYNQIAEKNKAIIELTENGSAEAGLYNELVFNVGKLDINILPDSFVNVYDIPGLNDARTKDIYYKYLETNFHKFNLVIFLVDVHSGLNTSDEIDIVNFITTHTRDQLLNNNRKIHTLVVVNKADDMQLNSNNDLTLTGELSEMYEQVEKTLVAEFAKKNISELLIGILPLCAIDAFLYRMVKKQGSHFKLSPEQILKIGINENGKKFSLLPRAEQESKVQVILNDAAFIDTMIKLSGFSKFEELLHKFLNENNTSKQIRIDNLLYDMRLLPQLSGASSGSWIDLPNFEYIVAQKCAVYDKIKSIDLQKYEELVSELLSEIRGIICSKVYGWNTSIQDLLQKFDNYVSRIIDRFFGDSGSDGYPDYVVSSVERLIMLRLDGHINIHTIITHFDFLKHIGSFNSQTITRVLQKIMKNIRANKSIDFVGHGLNAFVTTVKDIHAVVEDKNQVIKFMRFCIINQLHSMQYISDILVQKKMLYMTHGEVAINAYLTISAANSIDVFVDGLNESLEELVLDKLYLSIIA